jgi:hypothetical protein
MERGNGTRDNAPKTMSFLTMLYFAVLSARCLSNYQLSRSAVAKHNLGETGEISRKIRRCRGQCGYTSVFQTSDTSRLTLGEAQLYLFSNHLKSATHQERYGKRVREVPNLFR